MIITSTTADIRNRGCAVDAAAVPKGLRRSELTPDAKRWQLWGKGIRGAAADEVIERVYGPQRP